MTRLLLCQTVASIIISHCSPRSLINKSKHFLLILQASLNIQTTHTRARNPTYFVCSQPSCRSACDNGHCISYPNKTMLILSEATDRNGMHGLEGGAPDFPPVSPSSPASTTRRLEGNIVMYAGEGSVIARERFGREGDESTGPRSMASGQFSEHYSYLCSL
jgi:hypothetical protein